MDSVAKEKLHQSLLRLKPRQQIAIQMRFWEQFSISEIASVLGITWEDADKLIETTLCELKQKIQNLNGNSIAA